MLPTNPAPSYTIVEWGIQTARNNVHAMCAAHCKVENIILMNSDLCHGLSFLNSNFKYNSFYNSFTTLVLQRGGGVHFLSWKDSR